jgi:hypothetical protein
MLQVMQTLQILLTNPPRCDVRRARLCTLTNSSTNLCGLTLVDLKVNGHYRAHRRFIGPRWVFRYPAYFVQSHYRTHEGVLTQGGLLKSLWMPVEAGAAGGGCGAPCGCLCPASPTKWLGGSLREPCLGDRYHSVPLHLAGSFPKKPTRVSPCGRPLVSPVVPVTTVTIVTIPYHCLHDIAIAAALAS